ncbi:hypothetical protein NLU13_7046 [Sarocladium strictum]|uniref:WW domain-containing protein n=1 Tax=Sarocladium strictum TaxID=5046 RepID=A0AA39GG28_SARSR|nr:hypothetical protein NLU13_7046 [Sarocladium strictum]
MADYAPPSGPPPPPAPEVPAGWTARWNEQYKQWFYVNIYTKQSQWEKPTSPVYPPNAEPPAPSDPPPGYEPSNSAAASQAGDVKKNPYEERPPFNSAGTSSSDPDAALAAKLQAEEESRARGGGTPGYAGPGGPFPSGQSPYPAQAAPYGQPPGQQVNQGSFPQELPPRDRGNSSGGGFLDKLKAKVAGSSGSVGGGGYPQQQQYGGQPQQGGYYPPQQGYGPGPGGPGGYPGGYGGPQYNQGYGRGYGPPQGMYGQPQGAYGGGYPPQQRKAGGGMGMAGGAAMGLGAGVLGGMMLGSAMSHDDEQDAYEEGFADGADFDD